MASKGAATTLLKVLLLLWLAYYWEIEMEEQSRLGEKSCGVASVGPERASGG
jgi:hypothetical protein